jgi:hypothetical protein
MAQNSSSPNRGNFSTVYGIVLSLGTVILIIIILLLTYRFVRSRYGVPLLDPLSWANDRAIALQIAHLNHDGVAIGIDEETLDSFPKMLYSQKVCEPFKSAEGKELDEAEDNKCCSICLSDYKESEVVRVIPDCGHMFHMDCIDEWLHVHATCPICRTSPLPSLRSTPLAQEDPPTTIHSTQS